jgi:hypothetical protein
MLFVEEIVIYCDDHIETYVRYVGNIQSVLMWRQFVSMVTTYVRCVGNIQSVLMWRQFVSMVTTKP